MTRPPAQLTTGPVYLLSGLPGAGKSSVARALMARFPRGLHLPVDDLRELVVSGRADPSLQGDAEAARQFRLARAAAAGTARLYAEAGFAVAVDDVLWPQDDRLFLDPLAGLDVRRVFLHAGRAAALARNAARTGKPYPAGQIAALIEGLHAQLGPAEYRARGWAVLDTAALTLEQTVSRVLAL